MAFVKVRENEKLEVAIRRFKKKVDSEGIIKEFRERQYFKKPSEVKRLKKKEQIRKYKQKQEKQSKYKDR